MVEQGLKPNRARWREAARLRRQHLSLAAVGRVMGIRKQAVAYVLSRSHRAAGSRCHACDAPLAQRPLYLRYTVTTYCLACLALHPEAPPE